VLDSIHRRFTLTDVGREVGLARAGSDGVVMGHAGARAGGQSRPGGPGLADSPLTIEARSSRGVSPTHTEPQPDTAGGKHHKGGNTTRGNPPANTDRLRSFSYVD